jgi:hypothetical protein
MDAGVVNCSASILFRLSSSWLQYGKWLPGVAEVAFFRNLAYLLNKHVNHVIRKIIIMRNGLCFLQQELLIDVKDSLDMCETMCETIFGMLLQEHIGTGNESLELCVIPFPVEWRRV